MIKVRRSCRTCRLGNTENGTVKPVPKPKEPNVVKVTGKEESDGKTVLKLENGDKIEIPEGLFSSGSSDPELSKKVEDLKAKVDGLPEIITVQDSNGVDSFRAFSL